MKKHISTYLLATALLAGTAAPSWAASDTDIIATYNDQKVTRAEVLDKFQSMFGGQTPFGKVSFDELPANMQQEVVKNIVVARLVNKEASASKIQNTPEVKRLLAEQREQLINREFLLSKAKKSISESGLKDRYKAFKKEWGNKEEVKARHILVDSEDQAAQLVKDLKKGADFEKLAAEFSKDSNKDQGGDLGYFPRGRMVKPFEDAAFDLKKGEVSSPVKTDFGWHVIKLDDRRKVPVPSFDDLKPRLEQEMIGEWVQNHLNKLIETAKLDIKIQPKEGEQATSS